MNSVNEVKQDVLDFFNSKPEKVYTIWFQDDKPLQNKMGKIF